MAELQPPAVSPEAEQTPRPWTQAWTDALPIAPIWVGLALAAGHLLLGALYFAGIFAPRISAAWTAYQDSLLTTAVYALLMGYSTAALAYARGGYAATLRDLRPALGCNDAEFSALQDEVLRFDMAALRRIGLSVAIGAIVATYLTTDVVQRVSRPVLLWVLWQNGLCFWIVARTFAHDLRVSLIFSRETQRYAEIELFDLAPLTPLAGRGLQSALLIVLAISFFSLILGGDDVSFVVPVMQVATVLLAAFALVLPSLGIRRRVRAAKHEELARLSMQLRSLRAQAATTEGSNEPEIESRLATLLTLKQHVEATREWPFDLGTLGRFLLYAAIGVGSWLGGAAVERLLDVFLG